LVVRPYLHVVATGGVGNPKSYEMVGPVASAMLERVSRHVVVVADSSKLGRRAFARICPIGDVTTLVTDGDASDEQVGRFTELGVRVVRA
jgi:DeoR family transcriptional regulator of aga operon